MPLNTCKRRWRGQSEQEQDAPFEDAGAEAPRDADLETQGIASAAAATGGYGSAPQKSAKRLEELPLLFGKLDVDSRALLRVLVQVYVAFYTVNIVADAAYFATVDARFPAGLGYLYPSEWERQQSVSYTRQVLAVGMLQRTVVFTAVLLCVYFQAFAGVDAGLCWLATSISSLWEQGPCERCCGSTIGGFFAQCFSLIGKFLYCCCAPCRCCAAACSKCCCCCGSVKWLFANHSGSELLRGSVYLGLFAAAFFLLGAPFMYWRLMIDLDFGFANALTVTPAGFRAGMKAQFVQLLIWSVPGRFLYLALLRFRFGWLCMWAGTMLAMLITQYNFAAIVPSMMGMNNVFPADNFVIGRGFPLVKTSDKGNPWVSMNRIFFNVSGAPSAILATHDLSQGQLLLGLAPDGTWAIAARPTAPQFTETTVYARTRSAVPNPNASASMLLARLGEQEWDAGSAAARVGARSGKSLRDKVMGFAKDRNISIAEIYMVDGSHKDARANAFVGGINGSIIGLYDTLFLGSHENDGRQGEAPSALSLLSGGPAGVLALSELVQEVDTSEEDDEAVWSSVPTQAMDDDEIIAILAHELAHPDLGHLQQGMVLQAGSSLLTYAALGWAAHSPIFAAALALGAPLVHVGACAYGHIVGPSLDSVVKLFSDWLIRRNEYEADAYVARMSDKYGTALQTALAKLSVNSNQDPDMPIWYEALHADHPTTANRWANIEAVKQEKARKLKGGL